MDGAANPAGPAWWPYVAAALNIVLALAVSTHIVLNKRDDRSALMWIAVVVLSPYAGAVLYWLFGVNRIARRAVRLRAPQRRPETGQKPAAGGTATEVEAGRFFACQANLASRFAQPPFREGNRVLPLRHGDVAFPAMLEAIGAARSSVALSTYIFNEDPLGRCFIDALAAAEARGVEVRVLIDGVGALYRFPPIDRSLRRRGIRAHRFLAAYLPWRMPYLNLHNHRKILVVDGRIGFTGGMNLKIGHVLAEAPDHPTADLQFRIEGPAVADLMSVFADDWAFTSGETLAGPAWFPPLEPAGPALLRALISGPNEEQGAFRLTLLGALGQVHESLKIATPYFLPDPVIEHMLAVTALRGVAVDIVLPEVNNQFYV
jgi:cardiolipin synthase